jgi:C-terminal processing protease CtpA/Prc
MSRNLFRARAPFAALSFLLAAACSGSSSAPPTRTPPPPTSSGPTWTQGVFESASRFQDRCAVVRTGVDIEGNAFPDRQGTLLEELFWLRSWTNETYLWNTEVVDRNPANFSNRLTYFDVLRTTATTSSGKDKDNFHFSQPTAEFLAQRNLAPSASYGEQLIAISRTIPRDFRVLYTEPGSPAAEIVMGEANLVRGARILKVDNVDLVNANTQAEVNILNAGLFPTNAGEQHTFEVLDPGAAFPRTILMVSADIAAKPVNRTSVVGTPSGNVGYILFNTFSPFASEIEIANAIASMKAQGVVDIILDLRYNGGGLLAVASQLGYMIAGNARTSGKTFERLQFNAAAGNRNPVTGQLNQPLPFFDTGLGFSLPDGAPLQALDLPRVFVLSTDNTCSASESVINALRGVDVEVVLIGGATCGKPFGFFPTDNCGETYFTIQFQGVNNKNFGDYADGFIPQNSTASFGVRIPGCSVADDLNHDLGDPNEALLAAALQYRTSATWPPQSSSLAALRASTGDPSTAIDLPASDGVYDRNRDMRMPGFQ